MKILRYLKWRIGFGFVMAGILASGLGFIFDAPKNQYIKGAASLSGLVIVQYIHLGVLANILEPSTGVYLRPGKQ